MAKIQMWPQNQGRRNSISFAGRIYSSIPGAPIPVPDFDVPVLQANGWTTYATVAGKTTITMLPPTDALHNQILVNGRTYITTPGVPIEVQPFDAPVLQANGWSRMVYPPALQAISVPAGAIGLWSMIRTTPYTGPCLRIIRALDGASQDIYWNGNICDWATADAFAAGSLLSIVTWYDQSGSGNDLTQAVAANQPVFIPGTNWNGVRPVTCGAPGDANNRTAMFLANGSLAFNNSSCTIVTVLSPRMNYDETNYWRAAASSGGADVLSLFHSVGVLTGHSTGVGFFSNNQIPKMGMKVAAVSYGASTISDIEGVQNTYGASTSASLAYLSFGNSASLGGNAYNMDGAYFFAALYGASFTASQLSNLRTIVQNAFVLPAAAQYNLVYGGSSLINAAASTNSQSLPFVAGFSRATADDAFNNQTYPALPAWQCRSIAVAGRQLATEYGGRAGWLSNCLDATKAKNIFVMDAPSGSNLTLGALV